jgi:hypothetical protein
MGVNPESSAKMAHPTRKGLRSAGPVSSIPQKQFECYYSIQVRTESYACKKRFSRPEHLRRHMRTVHSDQKDKICKFPGYKKSFSRADNLQDHYWTHLDKGGRYGYNVQLSLEELERVLCPKEQDVYDRIERRLHACRKLGTGMQKMTVTAAVK